MNDEPKQTSEQPAPAAVRSSDGLGEWKVYRVNDCDWWMARSMDELRTAIAHEYQVGFHDQRGKAANKPTLSKREANATPPAFAHYLLELAATCAKWPNATSSATPQSGRGPRERNGDAQ